MKADPHRGGSISLEPSDVRFDQEPPPIIEGLRLSPDLAVRANEKPNLEFCTFVRQGSDEAQEREAALACLLLNRLSALGRPQSYQVREKRGAKG